MLQKLMEKQKNYRMMKYKYDQLLKIRNDTILTRPNIIKVAKNEHKNELLHKTYSTREYSSRKMK